MRRLFLASCLLFLIAGRSHGSDAATTAMSILERWTAFHWGRDCLVWLVHYPEELVEPWVEAEAARSGMSQAERDQYRLSFTSELRISEAEPFLLTVYVFSPRPLDLGRFESSIMLLTGDGRKIPPVSYERKFDQPLSGITQGLVFFPKQEDKDFTVVLRNLGIQEEQYFAFDGYREPEEAAYEPPVEREVVVVELPPAPKKDPPKPAIVVEEPQAPLPPPPPLAVATPTELAELAPQPVVDLPLPPQKEKDPSIYISKERTVENFVRHWIEGETGAMYDLLSDSTRTALTEDQFSRQVHATGLRASLKEGYKVQWMDEGHVRVVTAQRMLLFRTLRSKVLTVEREDTLWKVVW
ncbi:MAG: hypothetical protein WCY56_01685 [Aminobacteriaceae bacterium]